MAALLSVLLKMELIMLQNRFQRAQLHSKIDKSKSAWIRIKLYFIFTFLCES